MASAGYSAHEWETFAVAEVGAAAALAGLLVVACSINIERIIALPAVVNRLGATLTLFTGILVVGSVLLVPGLDHRLLGGLIAAVGATVTAMVYAQRGLRTISREYRKYTWNAAALGILAAVLMAVAGVAYATTAIGGLYWLVAAILIGFGIGLLNAWVALVEILR